MVCSQVRTDELISSIDAGLCLISRDFRIVWVNTRQSGWFGCSSEICGKHCYETFERRKHICRGCPSSKVFKDGLTHTARRIAYTKDNKKGFYQLTVSPIRDRNNKVIYALELVQDITEQVYQEKRSRRIIERLKKMYGYLSSVNQRLHSNIRKFREIVERIRSSNHVLEKKYNKKITELLVAKEELQEVFKINQNLSSAVNLKKVSCLVTRLSCELLHADACILRFLDEHGKILIGRSSLGLDSSVLNQISAVKVGESLCGKAAKTRTTLISADITKDRRIKNPEIVLEAGFRSLVCAPIVFQGNILGAITLFSKKCGYFSKDQLDILGMFASQIAIAMQESKYFDDMHVSYFNTIHALVLAIEARDPYTRGHTERVTKFSLQIARSLGMSEQDREIMRYAGEVHDVGKISIPDSILNKPGLLTPAERATIEMHPVKGAEMLEPLEFLKPAIPIVRYHHERYDGTGYPEGLAKDKIPIMARILACADSFDAMTSDRPYRRRKLTVEEAILEIKNNAGSQFDPHIAHTFVKIISSKTPLKALQ